MDNQQPSINTYILNKKPKRFHGFIYKYTSPSGKSYIGRTIQTLRERAKESGKGYRQCPVFYKAIQKYGYENMTVEILAEVEIEDLPEEEANWISFYNTLVPNGYNIGSELGPATKEVHQYDAKTGDYIASFSSLTEAARENGLKTIHYISKCRRGKQKTSHGFIWKKEKFDKVDPEDFQDRTPIKVYAYNLDGSFAKEFNSITEAAKAVGGNRNDIRRVARGEFNFSKGYIWRYDKVDKVKPVRTGAHGAVQVAQIDPKTGEILNIYGSQSEAARALGLSRSTGISKVCQGKQKTSAGYRWEIYEGSTTKDS